MGKGSGSTTTETAPFAPEYVQDILGQAGGLYHGGRLQDDAPEDLRAARRGVRQLARRGTRGVEDANATLSRLLDPQAQQMGIEGVRSDILGSAVPAAVSQFSGAGLTDSSVAQEGVGRAASQALAPFEFGAYQQQQDRALSAASLAPQLQAAQYLPYQQLMQSGLQQQQQRSPYTALERYASIAGPLATGQQSTSSGGGTSDAEIAGTIAQLAATAIAAFSDRRLKRDIKEHGRTAKGHKLYEFKYLWDDEVHIGVMADEVPEAIVARVGPYAVVDYGRIL